MYFEGKSNFVTGNVYNLKLHTVFSFLVPLRRSGRGSISKVGISPLLVINIFEF